MDTLNTITPQALGGLVKRLGILKSDSRKGNSYDYHTEGYALTRQYGDYYTISYYSRMQLSLESDVQRERFIERKRQAFETIGKCLGFRDISYRYDGNCLWVKGVK